MCDIGMKGFIFIYAARNTSVCACVHAYVAYVNASTGMDRASK